nr:hypothetical protein [Streptomyces qaidamensis]
MTPTAEPAQGNHRATYREVLAEPRFRLLFSTRTVAITADALRITTFSVLVFSATGSALLSALAFGIGFIPQLFGSLLLGSLADRLPPRALITGGYALTCASALLLALVRMPVAASLGVVALVALTTPVFHGSSSRLVAQSLEGDAYVLGRSLNNIAASGAQLFGLALEVRPSRYSARARRSRSAPPSTSAARSLSASGYPGCSQESSAAHLAALGAMAGPSGQACTVSACCCANTRCDD